MYTFGVIFLLAYSTSVESYRTSLKQARDIVNKINELNSTWKAAIHPHHIQSEHDHVDFKFSFGGLATLQSSDSSSEEDLYYCDNKALPKEYDPRISFPECASVIGHVYNQGMCGSCWAVATTSAFSDRVCIASWGRIANIYSAQQMTSCCHRCRRVANGTGCDGGWPLEAWSYIKRNGLCTGGDFNSNEGCQPYLFDSYTWPKKIPKCKLHCYNKSYNKTFKEDRIKVEKYYKVSPCAALYEIYSHGPIVSYFRVYEDFLYYRSGVYQYRFGKQMDFHVVRVIGWGEENGIPYWLAVNSWGEYWGDNGFFKIKRGSNELWFEDNLTAGIPKIPN